MNKTGIISIVAVVILMAAAFFAFSNMNANDEQIAVTTTEQESSITDTSAAVEADMEAETKETVVIESTTTSDNQTMARDDIAVDVDSVMQDRVLGSADAPVTIIEYASMTCSHCANFHNNVMGDLKRDLIDTGEVRYIFREFPLDAVALRASMMARCAPKDKFFGLLDVLFANQKRWVGAANPVEAMAKMGKLAGLTDSQIATCMADKDLETALLETRQNAQTEFDINSTPSFVFNDGAAVESGVLPIERIKEIVDGLN